MAHATAFFNRETTHFNGCSFFILNSDYKTLQQYMDSIIILMVETAVALLRGLIIGLKS